MTQSNLLRDRSVSDVVARVRRIEREIGMATAKERKFVKVGNWLIEAGHFRELWYGLLGDQRPTVVPYFAAHPKSRACLGVLGRWKIFQGLSAAVAADVVCVRNSIRTFYLKHPNPFSLKTSKSDHEMLKAFQRDIDARMRVSKHGLLKVPRIMESNLNGDDAYFTEEIVLGRLPRLPADTNTVVDLIKNPLWMTYVNEGLKFRPVSQVLKMKNPMALLARGCAVCPWDPRWLPKDEFLQQAEALIAGPGLMAFCFGHGDFGIHNILLTHHSDPYVIDWEHACEMAVVHEMHQAINTIPGVYEVLHQRMDELRGSHPEPSLLSFPEQFFINSLRPILHWARWGRKDRSASEYQKSTISVLHAANQILIQEREIQRGMASNLYAVGLAELRK